MLWSVTVTLNWVWEVNNHLLATHVFVYCTGANTLPELVVMVLMYSFFLLIWGLQCPCCKNVFHFFFNSKSHVCQDTFKQRHDAYGEGRKYQEQIAERCVFSELETLREWNQSLATTLYFLCMNFTTVPPLEGMSWSVCALLTAFLHLAWNPQGSSGLQHVPELHSYWKMNTIPLYVCALFVEGLLRGFSLVAVRSAALSRDMQISVDELAFTSFKHIPRSRITW